MPRQSSAATTSSNGSSGCSRDCVGDLICPRPRRRRRLKIHHFFLLLSCDLRGRMKNEPSPAVPSVAEEFANADLGDARRTGRLRIIAESWSAAPDQGVPTASKSSAKTEATYRFLNNPGVTYAPIVDAHIEQTRARVAEAGIAIVAHDTTEFAFGGEVPRTGLGRLKGGDQGFLGHLALAISADGRRMRTRCSGSWSKVATASWCE